MPIARGFTLGLVPHRHRDAIGFSLLLAAGGLYLAPAIDS